MSCPELSGLKPQYKKAFELWSNNTKEQLALLPIEEQIKVAFAAGEVAHMYTMLALDECESTCEDGNKCCGECLI